MCVYKKNEKIVVREISPSYFFVDITKCYNNENEKMFITDDIGIEIWNSIEDGDSFERILDKFLQKINDQNDKALVQTISSDMIEYLDILIQQGCLYEVEDEI